LHGPAMTRGGQGDLRRKPVGGQCGMRSEPIGDWLRKRGAIYERPDDDNHRPSVLADITPES